MPPKQRKLADYDPKLTADILEQVTNKILNFSAAATQLDTNAKQVSRWIDQLKKKRCTFAQLAAQCKTGRPKKSKSGLPVDSESQMDQHTTATVQDKVKQVAVHTDNAAPETSRDGSEQVTEQNTAPESVVPLSADHAEDMHSPVINFQVATTIETVNCADCKQLSRLTGPTGRKCWACKTGKCSDCENARKLSGDDSLVCQSCTTKGRAVKKNSNATGKEQALSTLALSRSADVSYRECTKCHVKTHLPGNFEGMCLSCHTDPEMPEDQILDNNGIDKVIEECMDAGGRSLFTPPPVFRSLTTPPPVFGSVKRKAFVEEFDGWRLQFEVLNARLGQTHNLIHLVNQSGQFYRYSYQSSHVDHNMQQVLHYRCQQCTHLQNVHRNRLGFHCQKIGGQRINVKGLPKCATLAISGGKFRFVQGEHIEGCVPNTQQKALALKEKRKSKLMVKQKIKTPKVAWRDGVVAAQKAAMEHDLPVRGVNSVLSEMGSWPQPAFIRFGNRNADGSKATPIVDPFGSYGELDKTRLGERWTLDKNADHGVVIFATDFNLQILANSEKLMADSTFRVTPNPPFSQYLTILAKVENTKWIPVVGALMKKKKEEIYDYIFNRILNACQITPTVNKRPVVKKFITDFEAGMQNAIKRVFGEEVVVGCLFHFTKDLMKHAGMIGLGRYYQDRPDGENEIYKWMRCIAALPLLPPNLVEMMWHNDLKKGPTCPPDWIPPASVVLKTGLRGWPTTLFQDLVAYVEKEWLQKICGIGNHYGSVEDRTTNAAEGYHGSLISLPSHQILLKFLRCIRDTWIDQEAKVTAAQQRSFDGKPPAWRNKKYVNNDRALAKAFQDIETTLDEIKKVNLDSELCALHQTQQFLKRKLFAMGKRLLEITPEDVMLRVSRKEGRARARRKRTGLPENAIAGVRSNQVAAIPGCGPHKSPAPAPQYIPAHKRPRLDEVNQRHSGPASTAPFGRGLINAGENVCFANSLLQVLTYTEPFQQAILAHQLGEACLADGRTFCMCCKLREHFEDALKLHCLPFTADIAHHLFMRKIMKEHSRGTQQDAQQFLLHILANLPMTVSKKSDFTWDYGAGQCFVGTFAFTERCIPCGHMHDKQEEYFQTYELRLPVNRATDILSMIGARKKPVVLDITCRNCSPKDTYDETGETVTGREAEGYRNAEQVEHVKNVPQILVLHLARFKNDGERTAKLLNHVHIQHQFTSAEMNAVGIPLEVGCIYTLYGAVVHNGGLKGGHYTSYVCRNDQWVEFDDAVVRECKLEFVNQRLVQGSYVLFYQKVHSASEQPDPVVATDKAVKNRMAPFKNVPSEDMPMILETIVNDSKIDFCVVDEEWQKQQCKLWELNFDRALCANSTPYSVSQYTPPAETLQCESDGNCFFRAISTVITGTQDQHALVRAKVVKFEGKSTDPYYKKERRPGKEYSLEYMAKDKTWASMMEIEAVATMTNSTIYTYSVTLSVDKRKCWLAFNPRTGADVCKSGKAIFLDHVSQCHYEVVTSLQTTVTTVPLPTTHALPTDKDSNMFDQIDKTLSALMAQKLRCQSMSLDEKRSAYSCGTNFVSVVNIAHWQAAGEGHKDSNAEITDGIPYLFDADGMLNSKVSLWVGDITRLEIDAIVNAANESLRGGGGVDGAIHRAAGTTELDLECSFHNGCSIGEAKMTLGYKLPAKFVIHTVGPRTEESELLASCYKTSLNLAVVKNIRTIAFPCISAGIYGYPNKDAAIVALKTVREWLQVNRDRIDCIIFVLFAAKDVKLYYNLMPCFFPLPPVEGDK